MPPTPRIRHARHRDFDGTERGTAGIRRLPRTHTFFQNRTADEADGGIGDTAEPVVFTADATVAAAAATGTLTATGNFSDEDEVVIGDSEYTLIFKIEPSEPGEVAVGNNLAESLENLENEINGLGIGDEHPDVTAASTATTLVVTAKVPGTDGNSIDTTTTASDASWGGATMSGGVDAAPGQLTVTDHDYRDGDGLFVLDSDGDLPEGLSDEQFYWVRVLDENTLTLHETPPVLP
jgi:hypothetical protein